MPSAPAGRDQSNLRFSRLIARVLVGGAAATIFGILGAVTWLSSEHNALAADHARRMVAGALNAFDEGLRTTTRDYAFWTEAFIAIRERDIPWLYANIGTGAAETGTVDLMLMVEPQDGGIYGWARDGGETPLETYLPAAAVRAVTRLLDQVPTNSVDARSGYLVHDGHLFLAAAARVLPFDTDLALDDADIPRLVFANVVDGARINAIGAAYFIEGLTVQTGPGPHAATIEVPLLTGGVAHVAWQAPRPGDEILMRAAPLLALGVVALGLIALTASRQVVSSAQRLERAVAMAEAANRAKSEFLANVSHELRTPMNGVLGVTQILSATPLTEDQSSWLRVLQSSAERQIELISDLLDVHRIESGEFTLSEAPFEPAQVVDEVVRLMGPTARGKGLDLNADLGPAPIPVVLGDRARFQQVVTNLVGNAIKFTERGHVIARLAARRRQDTLRLTLVVEDTGRGIDPADLERIFERFTQADSSRSRNATGAGLGLAICKSIVGLMGGTLSVTSTLGTGSAFSVDVTFEIAQQAAAADVPA